MKNPFAKLTRIELSIIIMVVILILIASVFLMHNIQNTRKAGGFGPRNPISDMLMNKKREHKTELSDIEYINEWMTFSYINVVFDLPADYLGTSLEIQDKRYPEIPIGRYVKNVNIDKALFISQVKSKVREYMSSHPAK